MRANLNADKNIAKSSKRCFPHLLGITQFNVAEWNIHQIYDKGLKCLFRATSLEFQGRVGFRTLLLGLSLNIFLIGRVRLPETNI